MGRFNLNLRPIYDQNEPTFGEGLQRGVQGGLDYYAQRREAARQEGNTARSQGGTRNPDEARPGIRQRIRGIGARLGEIVHGRLPGLPDPSVAASIQPTPPFSPQQAGGTFAPTQPSRPGALPMDEEMGERPGMPDPDDMVTQAIAGRPYQPYNNVVPPTPPIGALPPSPRLGGTGPRAPLGGPMLYDQPERTFDYEGSDGAHYTMPQAGERERRNKILEYGAQTEMKSAADDQNDQRTADRQLEHDKRMVDYYDRRDTTRGEQQAAHDQRLGEIRARLARLTGAGRGNSPEALELRREKLELEREKEGRLAEQGAASLDARVAETQGKGIVRNPRDKRIMSRDPKAVAANDARQASQDAALQRAAAGANRIRNGAASEVMKKARAQELKQMGLTKEKALAQMQAEGYRVTK